ncbi:MAG: RNA polymerase subunit sigma-70 [Pedosphaera sp. Tous-C6FEB]|nr:MAG: RNA polymerase subunit sigma-70 [Pedosphaera sp. Tous-C6FEB]
MKHEDEIRRRETLARLWLEAEPSVRAFVGVTVSGFQDVQDVVQQVALTVARRFEEYDEARPFLAWALWLAKSRIADHHRKRGREKVVFSDALMDQLAEGFVERQPERSARQEALERCLARLPEKSRQMLQLRYENESSVEQVARTVESTAASVRVMLFRIRNLLADCIQKELSKEASS